MSDQDIANGWFFSYRRYLPRNQVSPRGPRRSGCDGTRNEEEVSGL